MADMTVQAIQALKAGSSYAKLKVSSGLYIGVATNGEKTFFVRCTVKGSNRIEYRIAKPFGVKAGPASTTLIEARAKAAEITALGRQGINYQEMLEAEAATVKAQQAKQESENYTVQDLYNAWFPTTHRKDEGEALGRSFEGSILPTLGSTRLRDLEEGHIRSLITPVSKAGLNRKAIVMLNNLKQMFKWANGRRPWKLLLDDPTINLRPRDVTQPGYEETERDRVLSRDEIKLLAAKLKTAGLVPNTELAIWIVLACCTRIGETIMAEWKHVDLENGVWLIPEANTKGRAPTHKVYLSEFAIKKFTALKALTGHTAWCFPNRAETDHLDTKSPTKQIGDRQASLKTGIPLKNRTKAADALVLLGDNWTFHDLRRTGATLAQSVGVDQHVIERMANHAEDNRMLRIYQRYDYADEQRAGWEKLGKLLDELTSS
jgi:integrase